MSSKHELRTQRTGTVINLSSRTQESELGRALKAVVDRLIDEFEVALNHEKQWFLSSVVDDLRRAFPDIDFNYHFEASSMRPDGGILSIQDIAQRRFPILIAEVKNQGTNDLRLREGKPRQAKGNAIERLGKNVIGFRTALMPEGIVPFICFGYGCDFAEDSSILDRVSTIAMFGQLNQINVVNEGDHGRFNRGSFFFREDPWSIDEMIERMYTVASRAIYYYYSKYGIEKFKRLASE